jgi:hypothetical protein
MLNNLIVLDLRGMLSLLAKIKSAVNGNSSQLDSILEEENVEVKDSLIQLSEEVDRQLIKLKALLNGSTAESPEDRAVIISATREYGTEIRQLDSMATELEVAIGQSARQTDDLVVMISRLIRLQPNTPIANSPTANVSMDSARRLSRFATPLRADQSTPK